MKLKELLKKKTGSLKKYFINKEYLQLVKEQGTYESYVGMYLDKQEEQFRKEFNTSKIDEYQQYVTYFKEIQGNVFTIMDEIYNPRKMETCCIIKLPQIFSRDISDQTNVGTMLGSFLKRYPNFNMTVDRDNCIVLEVYVDLSDKTKIKDNQEVLEEIEKRVELLR